MKKNTKRILKYLIEFLIVAFGVFLGIYVSELQSEQKLKKEKEASINFILEELSNNKKNLERSINYHQSIKVELDSIAKTFTEKDLFKTYLGNDVFRHHNIKGWEGIALASLENTAFEAAKISGIIKEFDIELIQKISKIYNYQEEYVEFGNTILTKMININATSKIADAFGTIELMAYDLLNFEETLVDEIEKVKMLN